MLKQNSSDKPFENGWLARLKLLFRQSHGESIMADNTHIGPLRVQRTFKAEDESRHVYILHPPGGYVAGDLIDIHVETQDSSHVVVTSPGASKFYRCEPGNPNKQTQTLNLRAKQHSLLEWLPPETIFFKDANAHLERISNLMPTQTLLVGKSPASVALHQEKHSAKVDSRKL